MIIRNGLALEVKPEGKDNFFERLDYIKVLYNCLFNNHNIEDEEFDEDNYALVFHYKNLKVGNDLVCKASEYSPEEWDEVVEDFSADGEEVLGDYTQVYDLVVSKLKSNPNLSPVIECAMSKRYNLFEEWVARYLFHIIWDYVDSKEILIKFEKEFEEYAQEHYKDRR